jgi:hypothetical protein
VLCLKYTRWQIKVEGGGRKTNRSKRRFGSKAVEGTEGPHSQGEGMAQMVKHQLSKGKLLTSNLSPTKLETKHTNKICKTKPVL